MLSHTEIIDAVVVLRDQLKQHGVVKIALFGSFAQERAHETSDLDFLVEFAPNRGLYDDYMHVKQLLEHRFNRSVDIVKPHLIRNELREDILSGVQYEAKI